MDKLAVIQQCIFNDQNAIKELECHLAKLYQMRDEELASEGITVEEWEKAIEELRNRCKKN